MADDKDRYAEARASLRDTAKWYSASLAALGAALAGGLSFGILPDLGGKYLGIGILVGVVVFCSILAAIFLVQEILFPKPFGQDMLDKTSVRTQVDPFLDELLPNDINSLDELHSKFNASKTAGNDAEIRRLRTVYAKITSFAAFLDLQRKIRRANWGILFFFVVACAGIGYLAYLQGVARKAADDSYVAVEFSPGMDWSDFAEALAAACHGETPMPAEGKSDAPFDGWWTIRLKGPDACAGAEFAVPSAVVTPGG